MWVPPVPHLALSCVESPPAPTSPRTFTKRDAVQVAALEEAGLDGAGLRGEQPALPSLAGLGTPRPQHPWVPCPHPPTVSPGPSPGGWCSFGCTSAPARPSKASGAALSPSLRRSEAAAVTPGQGAPRGDIGTHATDRDSHTGCSCPAAKPWEPPKSGYSIFWSLKNIGVLIPQLIGKPQPGWEEVGAGGKDAGCCPLPRGSSGRHDAEHPRGPCREWGWERRQDWAAQAASYLSIQRKYWRWGSDRCPCHRLLHAACRKTPG